MAGHNFGMLLHKFIVVVILINPVFIEGHTRITTILSSNLHLFNSSEVIIVFLAWKVLKFNNILQCFCSINSWSYIGFIGTGINHTCNYINHWKLLYGSFNIVIALTVAPPPSCVYVVDLWAVGTWSRYWWGWI